MDTDPYLIWSHEHSGWWGPAHCSYTKRLSLAGRYSRQEALDICANAMAGNVDRLGCFPELPVREADIHAAVELYPYPVGIEKAL